MFEFQTLTQRGPCFSHDQTEPLARRPTVNFFWVSHSLYTRHRPGMRTLVPDNLSVGRLKPRLPSLFSTPATNGAQLFGDGSTTLQACHTRISYSACVWACAGGGWRRAHAAGPDAALPCPMAPIAYGS